MTLVDRYIGKTILQTIFIVLLAMIGLEFFIMMIGELSDIGQNNYTLFSAVFYVLLNLPDQIYQFFPMVGLIGMLMGFGLLANHSELIILQSSGVSPLRIAFSALKTIILLLIVVSIMGELIAPQLSVYATDYKEKKTKNIRDPNIIAYNFWLRMGNNFLYVQKIDKQNKLHYLSWYNFDDAQQLIEANNALDAEYKENKWYAHQVNKTIFSEHATKILSSEEEVIPFTITPAILLESTRGPYDMSLSALHQSLLFHQQHHLENELNILSFWRRMIQLIASLVMMLLAIPCVFGPLRHASNSLRLVIGIAIGFCFYYLNVFFGPVVLLFHWSPLIGALLPTIIFGVLGVFLL